ncbi:MAG TPA: glycosyltransferase [Opitutaceae bacterium]|nr:glycosyltransferase [Opitutaceae bacterium]
MIAWPPGAWKKLLLLAVHPDDETLAAGGLIQRALSMGSEVRIIVVTDGEDNPWPQRFVERRWNIGPEDRLRWGKMRRAEALEAIERLGVPREQVSFWHEPDQGLTRNLRSNDRRLIERLADEIVRERPTMLVAPSLGDLHPDHSALALFLQFALESRGLERDSSILQLRYLVHPKKQAFGADGLRLDLSPQEMAAKRGAIGSYRSQLALSGRRFLGYARPAEVFQQVGDVPHPRPMGAEIFAKAIPCALELRLSKLAKTATVLIAAEGPGRVVRQSIRFGVLEGGIIRDDATGEVVGRARRSRQDGFEVILLPFAEYTDVRSIAVKVENRWGAYDRSAWQSAQIAQPQEETGESRFGQRRRLKICSVIPCYNVEGACGPVIRAAAEVSDHVIVVNDGSTDATEGVLREVAEKFEGRVHVLSFAKNKGKGVALMEAFRHATSSVPFDILVTLDGDGQHRPEDIPRMAEAMTNDDAMLVGERMERNKMPLRSRIGNTLTAVLLRTLYPNAPLDTQSGFRAFRRDFVQEIAGAIKGGRYETELEILLFALRKGRQIGSATIPTVYFEFNRLSHFRPLMDSLRIYRTLLMRQFIRSGE